MAGEPGRREFVSALDGKVSARRAARGQLAAMHHNAEPTNFIPREERRRVVVQARVRSGAGWNDACILNVSSRGLLIYANCATRPGRYVELHRGEQVIVAKVVWRNNQRMGLFSNDRLPVEQIISNQAAAGAAAATAGELLVERRKRPRDPERSRERARAMEFLSLVLIGLVVAGALAAYATQTLSRPLAKVTAALAPR